MAKTDWNPVLREEFEKPYWAELQQFVAQERASHEVFPPDDEVFAALHLTRFADARVMILGQDPYHGPGQAHGLCFSVQPGVKIPPSLVNVYKELHADLGISPAPQGNLTKWAEQGVLLLNSVLTVRAHEAASHRNRGWETFTDRVITAMNDKPTTVVFILWGSYARAKKKFIDIQRHVVIESPHPSPLSASRGFFGSKPFSQTNNALASAGLEPIDWRVS